MLKTQVNRVNVLEDGADRLGLINLEKIPIKESVKIKHGKRIFVPMEFSALGMPILTGTMLEEYLHYSDIVGPEVIVQYEEASIETPPSLTENSVKVFMENNSLRDLALWHQKHAYNEKKGGYYWLLDSREVVVGERYVLTPDAKLLVIDRLEKYPMTPYAELKSYDVFKKDVKSIRSLDIMTVLRYWTCPVCGEKFSVTECVKWEFELSKDGPVHIRCNNK